ncbi:MAG TPA: pilus assembly protein TadG-related protein [Caulobacteraceae bacterium]|jgi:Flp pilus assembly protein TadG|nr:pilus assembly protein TadG-related protein [Caulobacteraceae bacterium]
MKPHSLFVRGRFGRFRADERGATAIIVALMMTAIIGMVGFVIDVGHVMTVQRQLQASTDSAALAGAQEINCCATGGTALTTATSYGAAVGEKNAIGGGVTATWVSGYPQLKCLTTTGVSCTGSDSANAIVVKQQAVVPMWFAQILGIHNMTIAATSTAGATGGPPKSLDIELVLDTTASMNTADSNCSIRNATRLQCAEAGAQSLLTSLGPSEDQVGIMTFPGVQNSTQAAKDFDCSSSNPTIVSYKNSPDYTILGLAKDFKTSDSSSTLSSSSSLVKAMGGGGSGCSQGLSAVGGYGTFYGDAIAAAQTNLTSTGRSGVQKVIIMLSDGDANASSSDMPSGKSTNQCHQAITSAQNAAKAGTWVYTIAYGASNSSSGSCSTDQTKISACSTLSQMASDSKFFYSDNSGGTGGCNSGSQSASELVSIFKSIGSSFGAPRLLPDNTT